MYHGIRVDNALATSTVSRLLSSWKLLSFYSRRYAVWCYWLCWILLGQYMYRVGQNTLRLFVCNDLAVVRVKRFSSKCSGDSED